MSNLIKVKATNKDSGPRIFNASPAVILQAGQSTDGEVLITEDELASMKLFGSFEITGGGKASEDKPDYERDSLKDVDLHKPATSKDMLLVIAAYEKATVPQGDDATKADLIKAIEANRKAKG